MRDGEPNTRVYKLSTASRARPALGLSWPANGSWPVRLLIGSHSSKKHQARRAASHPGPGPCGTWYVPSLTKKWLGVDSSGVLPPTMIRATGDSTPSPPPPPLDVDTPSRNIPVPNTYTCPNTGDIGDELDMTDYQWRHTDGCHTQAGQRIPPTNHNKPITD